MLAHGQLRLQSTPFASTRYDMLGSTGEVLCVIGQGRRLLTLMRNVELFRERKSESGMYHVLDLDRAVLVQR